MICNYCGIKQTGGKYICPECEKILNKMLETRKSTIRYELPKLKYEDFLTMQKIEKEKYFEEQLKRLDVKLTVEEKPFEIKLCAPIMENEIDRLLNDFACILLNFPKKDNITTPYSKEELLNTEKNVYMPEVMIYFLKKYRKNFKIWNHNYIAVYSEPFIEVKITPLRKMERHVPQDLPELNCYIIGYASVDFIPGADVKFFKM